MMRSTKNSLLAAAALALLASHPAQADAPESAYPTPTRWAPDRRSGNNRRADSARRHAKAKAAYKSKRAQRKAAKR